jgi:hypothetical protein
VYTEYEHLRADLIEATTVRAAVVEIVDKSANSRIKMYVSDDDRPVIALQDAQARDRLYVSHDENGRGLLIFTGDDEGHRASIGLADDGRPEIRLSDGQGQLAAIIYVDDGRPALIMYDAIGHTRASMFLDEDGGPYIMFNSAAGQSQAKITVQPDGPEGLVLEDREGRTRMIRLSEHGLDSNI